MYNFCCVLLLVSRPLNTVFSYGCRGEGMAETLKVIQREELERIVNTAEELYNQGIDVYRKALMDIGFKEREIELLEAIEHMMRNIYPKLRNRYPSEMIKRFKQLYYYLMLLRSKGELPVDENYIGDYPLADTILKRAYYLKDRDGNIIEKRPEDMFVRIASFIAAAEKDIEKGMKWAVKYYNLMYRGSLSPAGRVRAGAGDLYRIKTLSNCYFLKIEEDSIEGIWKTSYQMARTYSYGGGVGTDVSVLRPSGSVVHNASNTSTGPTSFMYLYSLTTGIIGQEGRRGALMITMDVKHPDILKFIRVKRDPDWLTNMIMDEIKMSGKFSDEELKEIEKAVVNNVQIRFANISVKFNDEFFMALDEQDRYGKDKILLYKKLYKGVVYDAYQDGKRIHYSVEIPSREIEKYELIEVFDSVEQLNHYLLSNYGVKVKEEELKDPMKRDIYGDYVIELPGEYDLAVRYAGDFMLYFGSEPTGSIKRLVKAREIWNAFVESNWRSAEPGLIFWTNMVRYSPSNYVGEPIMGTNPCGEVPLEHGGACVLSSLNLLSFVRNPFENSAYFDWEAFRDAVHTIVRFLDSVVEWNIYMHPLEDQRRAMEKLRRIGAGIMGLADMFIALGIEYDSEEALQMIEEIMSVYANEAYRYSSLLSEEKGPFPKWNYEDYSKNPYFNEVLWDDVKESIKLRGLRNVTLLSIAPTGNTSNSTRALVVNGKPYTGVSSGIEPVFALYYTRRTEAVDKGVYKIFHPVVQAYIDKHGLNDEVQRAEDIEELKKILPSYFFRTAHVIDPLMRVKIQGIIQKYVDSSISSTVNLPEDIHPETVGMIYREAWKNRLKGITVYREGSRFAILSVDGKKTEFQQFKEKKFRIYDGEKVIEVFGDTILELPDGRLTTVYHAIKEGIIRPKG